MSFAMLGSSWCAPAALGLAGGTMAEGRRFPRGGTAGLSSPAGGEVVLEAESEHG